MDALRTRERRVAVSYLARTDEPVPIESVQRRVVSTIVEDGSVDEARRVETSLRHVHLPKLDDLGVVTVHDDGYLAYEGFPALEAILDGVGVR